MLKQSMERHISRQSSWLNVSIVRNLFLVLCMGDSRGQIQWYPVQNNIGESQLQYHCLILSSQNLRLIFLKTKKAHYELCSLMPEVISKTDDLEPVRKVIDEAWCDLLPSSDNFDMELQRWKHHCTGIRDKSITSLLSQDADPIFFPILGSYSAF